MRSGQITSLPQGPDSPAYIECDDGGIEYIYYAEDGRVLAWGPEGPSFTAAPVANRMGLKQPVIFTTGGNPDLVDLWGPYDPKSPEVIATQEEDAEPEAP
ncbi:MAG: hypothetical protein PHH01_00885 [Patescibacteria group bacterium]|nr:hypothetical protein [Patescibacteria group bacterium]